MEHWANNFSKLWEEAVPKITIFIGVRKVRLHKILHIMGSLTLLFQFQCKFQRNENRISFVCDKKRILKVRI